MPVTKERQRRYPGGSLQSKPWKILRARILTRAYDRCEGSPDYPGCRARNGKPHPTTGSKVVLTIAHMDHDPANNRESNLRALCQRCHLFHDREDHARSRRRSEREALEAAGQARMF